MEVFFTLMETPCGTHTEKPAVPTETSIKEKGA